MNGTNPVMIYEMNCLVITVFTANERLPSVTNVLRFLEQFDDNREIYTCRDMLLLLGYLWHNDLCRMVCVTPPVKITMATKVHEPHTKTRT